MWGHYEGICPIIAITNAQNGTYWHDQQLPAASRLRMTTALWPARRS